MKCTLKHTLRKITYIITAVSIIANSMLLNAATELTSTDNHVSFSAKIMADSGKYKVVLTAFNISNEYFLNGRFIVEDPTELYNNILAISPYYEISSGTSLTASTVLAGIPQTGYGYLNVVWSYCDDPYHPEEEVYRIVIALSLPDTTPPTITLTPNTTQWTNSSIINITATDNTGVTGLSINGTALAIGTTAYQVYTNGVYTVTATDASGNIGTATITIANIDYTKPNVTIILN